METIEEKKALRKGTVIMFGEKGMTCLNRDFLPALLDDPEMAGAKMTMSRASHVEPDPEYQEKHGLNYTPWYVDLSPVGGPAKVTGFKFRQEALDYEETWINNNVLSPA